MGVPHGNPCSNSTSESRFRISIVIVHSAYCSFPDLSSLALLSLLAAVIDVFRFENGKIVEHWDVVQTIPESAAHNNGMF